MRVFFSEEVYSQDIVAELDTSITTVGFQKRPV